jgi:RHS repeat-associated protein
MELIGQSIGGQARTILVDTQQSPVAIVDAGGSTSDRYRYSAQGELISRTGASAQPIRFGGYLSQDGTDELYAFARTYLPALGRFNQVDPVTSFDALMPMGAHRYVYGYGNSLRFVDPDGRIGYLSDLVGNFDQINADLRNGAENSDGLAGFGYNAARGFMGVGSWLARGTNAISDAVAQSAPMRAFNATAGVADQGAANMAPMVDAVGSPMATARAVHANAVETTSRVLEGDRGAASDMVKEA